jgi:hypothetical protein
LTQLLFIFEQFDEIIGPEENGLYLGRWTTRWTAIEGARGYFDNITEERVDTDRLDTSTDPFSNSSNLISSFRHSPKRFSLDLPNLPVS